MTEGRTLESVFRSVENHQSERRPGLPGLSQSSVWTQVQSGHSIEMGLLEGHMGLRLGA